jgi:hypothetical protein
LSEWEVYFDYPDLEIDFVAHSGAAHVAIGTAQAMGGFVKVDKVVSLGGFFKAYDYYWHSPYGLSNIGDLYDIIGPQDTVHILRDISGFNAYHTWGSDLWAQDKVHYIQEGTTHSSYFTDEDVWTHLKHTTVGLCKSRGPSRRR